MLGEAVFQTAWVLLCHSPSPYCDRKRAGGELCGQSSWLPPKNQFHASSQLLSAHIR